MTNREKVIKALSDELVDKRNQRYASARMSFEFIEMLIDLLNEQEHKDKMFHALEEDWKRLKELLKEQKAVEPKTGHWIWLQYCANEGVYCSECHMKIFDRVTKPKDRLSRYCPHCGSKNEQFFRDGEVVFR